MYRNPTPSFSSLRHWRSPWQAILASALGIALMCGVTPLLSAPQNPGKGRDKPPKERKEDAKERKEDAKERTEDAKERKEDAADRAKDRKPDIKDKGDIKNRVPARAPDRKAGVDVRVPNRAFVNPQVSTRVNTYWNRVGPARRPFTATWYKSHPGAWRYSFAIRGPWLPATYPTVSRFVGITAGPVAYSYESPNALSAAQWSSLAASVKSAEAATEEDLMSLGAFSLLPPDASESSTIVQLAIAKDGFMAGSYYDALSDTGQPINGSLDRQSQRVVWSIGNNRDVAFETGLENLTSEAAPVTVHTKDGGIQKWTMVRVAEAPSESAR